MTFEALHDCLDAILDGVLVDLPTDLRYGFLNDILNDPRVLSAGQRHLAEANPTPCRYARFWHAGVYSLMGLATSLNVGSPWEELYSTRKALAFC